MKSVEATATALPRRPPEPAREHRHVARRLAVRTPRRVLFIPVAEISRIESSGNYVQLHTTNAVHRMRATMNDMEARLDPETFIRVHRCTIVNIAHVEEIRSSEQGGHTAVMTDGQRLSISRSHRRRLWELVRSRFLVD